MGVHEACGWEPLLGKDCICSSPRSLARITVHRAKLLTLISSYQTNDAIADVLGVALATVKREVEDLRDVTGCRSKGQLAHWWADHRSLWDGSVGRRNDVGTKNGSRGP